MWYYLRWYRNAALRDESNKNAEARWQPRQAGRARPFFLANDAVFVDNACSFPRLTPETPIVAGPAVACEPFAGFPMNTTASCPSCGQALRIPQGAITLRCPKCGKPFSLMPAVLAPVDASITPPQSTLPPAAPAPLGYTQQQQPKQQQSAPAVKKAVYWWGGAIAASVALAGSLSLCCCLGWVLLPQSGDPEQKSGAPTKNPPEVLASTDTLTPTDPAFEGKPAKRYKVRLEAGRQYVIDMKALGGQPFKPHQGRIEDLHDVIQQQALEIPNDPYLILLDSQGKEVARDDDSGGGLDARIRFSPKKSGDFTVVATCLGGVTVSGAPFMLSVKRE
jgi:hypothetical protein